AGVARVEEQDKPWAGDVAGQSDRESVDVGSGERELPDGKTETPRELFDDPEGVLGREHEGEPAPRLFLDRADDGRRGMTHHRPGVAEAEIEIPMPVDIGQIGTLGAFREDPETSGPPPHPLPPHPPPRRPP